MSISGGGVGFGVAAGGAVASDVILFGELLGEIASNPTISAPGGSAELDGKLSFVAFGPGITYYIMPANVHLGVSALLTRLSFDVDDVGTAHTDWGFGGAARIGKDFWLSNSVGLGVMGQVTVATMKDSESLNGETPNWNSTTATLAIEMTYH
jgi:hypothetical protein